MKTKVCPCCDQPITGMYCKGCRKIVWKPVEQDITYFLNTRHPENETDCTYHNDTWQTHKPSRTGDPAVRSAKHKMTSSETEAKKAEIRARLEAGKQEVMRNFGVGAGSGTKKQAAANWMMPKQVQTVLNGDVLRTKKTTVAELKRREDERKRTGRIVLLTTFLVIFVIVFTFVMILVINSMNGVTRSFAVPELESFLKEAEEYKMELPTAPATDAAAMEEWELTDEEVRAAGVACNGFGHSPVKFEDVSMVFSNCILDAGYGWTLYDAFSYNQFIDEYTWYETMYEYTIHNEDENAGYINVNVDTATGEIHAIEVYSRSEDEFYEVADIALKFIEKVGMSSDLPTGIDFYEEALEVQEEEFVSFQYGLEVVAYKPEPGEEYVQYHMSVYVPGYYGVTE